MPDSKSTTVSGQLLVVFCLAGQILPMVADEKPLHIKLTKIWANFII